MLLYPIKTHDWEAYEQIQTILFKLKSSCDCDLGDAQTQLMQINVIQNEYNSDKSYHRRCGGSNTGSIEKFMTAVKELGACNQSTWNEYKAKMF